MIKLVPPPQKIVGIQGFQHQCSHNTGGHYEY